MLHINDLTYRIGGRVLFEGATLAIDEGQKVGLVGRNGAGKSTLFKLIEGGLAPDGGSIQLRRGMRLGSVAQEVPGGSKSLIDTVLDADEERVDLLTRAETATDPVEIADVHNRLADIGADSAPARAARILAGLGFDEAAQARPCGDFSGGWRMRVALAAALFARPDILLLDEPTNHLDLEAADWLEGYLEAWSGTLLIISHDRTLLNRVVKEIAHLENTRLVRYAGGYDRFERTRRERMESQAKLQRRQLEERRRIQSFVDRFRAKATKARQAQSRMKMLERMEPIASVIEDRTVSFHFPNPDPLSPPLLNLDHVAAGYEEGNPVLSRLDLRVDMDDRIALLGANGNGKSTLVKLLAERLKPMDGKAIKSRKLKVGYFAQHQQDELRPDETPYHHLARIMEMTPEAKVRAHLGRFGFPGEKADTPVKALSGGEKARLLFCLMSTDAPHILLLDEPTNHLDVDAREALIHALNEYDGAVILVSHDAHLVEAVADRLWLVEDGTCHAFEGDLGDYRQHLAQRRRDARRQRREEGSATNGKSKVDNKKQLRKERAERRAETASLRKEAVRLEGEIEKLGNLAASFEERLADPEVYQGATSKLMDLQVKHKAVKDKLASAEQRWLEIQETLERAAAE